MNWINFTESIYLRKILGFVLIFLSIFPYALPIWLDFLIAIIFQCLLNSLKEVIGVALILLLVSLLLSYLWGDRGSSLIWYREHEKWAVGQRYSPMVKDVIHQPFGDLVATNRSSTPIQINDLKEARIVEFQTDKFGYRNKDDIGKAKFVLVGDSFIVGNGTTQLETASEWFRKFTGEKVANIAFPGTPDQYEEQVLTMIENKNIDENASFVIFYFEGNDFYQSAPPKFSYSLLSKTSIFYDKLELQKDRVLNYLHPRDQTLFRLVRRSSHTINTKLRDVIRPTLGWGSKIIQQNKSNDIVEKSGTNKISKDTSWDEAIETRQVGKKLIGFFGHENQATEQNNLKAYIFKDSYLLSRIKAVVFIPTKWRVYSRWVDAEPTNSAFDFLSNSYSKFNIPVYDLSKALSKEASRLLVEDKYVYWRDDSHWNGYGIKAAMEYLSQWINLRKVKE